MDLKHRFFSQRSRRCLYFPVSCKNVANKENQYSLNFVIQAHVKFCCWLNATLRNIQVWNTDLFSEINRLRNWEIIEEQGSATLVP